MVGICVGSILLKALPGWLVEWCDESCLQRCVAIALGNGGLSWGCAAQHLYSLEVSKLGPCIHQGTHQRSTGCLTFLCNPFHHPHFFSREMFIWVNLFGKAVMSFTWNYRMSFSPAGFLQKWLTFPCYYDCFLINPLILKRIGSGEEERADVFIWYGASREDQHGAVWLLLMLIYADWDCV